MTRTRMESSRSIRSLLVIPDPKIWTEQSKVSLKKSNKQAKSSYMSKQATCQATCQNKLHVKLHVKMEIIAKNWTQAIPRKNANNAFLHNRKSHCNMCLTDKTGTVEDMSNLHPPIEHYGNKGAFIALKSFDHKFHVIHHLALFWQMEKKKEDYTISVFVLQGLEGKQKLPTSC